MCTTQPTNAGEYMALKPITITIFKDNNNIINNNNNNINNDERMYGGVCACHIVPQCWGHQTLMIINNNNNSRND